MSASRPPERPPVLADAAWRRVYLAVLLFTLLVFLLLWTFSRIFTPTAANENGSTAGSWQLAAGSSSDTQCI